MIFTLKNKEYCLTDWRGSFHTDMWMRFLIDPISGIVDKKSFIGLVAGKLGWYLTSIGELEMIGNIHKKIFPDFSINFDNLEQGQKDIDKFLIRIDKIKSFI